MRLSIVRAPSPPVGIAPGIAAMRPEHEELAVEIVRCVDDAGCPTHSLARLLPSALKTTWIAVTYPRRAGLRCTAMARWMDGCVRELVKISTAVRQLG